jgi:phosphoenolpyruvate carboxykinase (GTP)
MPRYQDLNWQGLAFTAERFAKIMAIDPDEARAEARDQEELFDRFGSRLPAEMEEQRQLLLNRLDTAAPPAGE